MATKISGKLATHTTRIKDAVSGVADVLKKAPERNIGFAVAGSNKYADIKKINYLFSSSNNIPAHMEKGKYGKKLLKPSNKYTVNGYFYETDDLRRLKSASGDLRIQKEKRNAGDQLIVGGDDRLPVDHGGHLMASMFGGSGVRDNLVAMHKKVNGSGGSFYKLEQEWKKALNQGDKVYVDIGINYLNDSLRPDSFDIFYKINGVTKNIKLTNNP